MLATLRIRDLAVIEALELEFEDGFSALTGETGAGKSILVDALSLVLGGRASAELIRTGAAAAEVEARFELHDAPAALQFIEASGLGEEPAPDGPASQTEGPGELIIRRLVSRTGRNRIWINGRLEGQARLFELGRRLVDIYGQHEHQTLLRPEMHCGLLDGFGGLHKKLEAYQESHRELAALEAEKKALVLDEQAKRDREDMLRFRVRELEAAGLALGEDDELTAEREILRHAETLIQAGQFALEGLYDSDQAAAGLLAEVASRLEEAQAHDPGFAGPGEQIKEAAALIEDAVHQLRSRVESIEADPARLAWIEDRLDELKRLKRKYGGSLESAIKAQDEAKAELAGLARQEERLKELEAKIARAEERARSLAVELTRGRKAVGERLAREVERELKGMGMDKVRFEALIEEAGGLGPEGADRVEFFLSPNPGEDLKPLAKIASGGELSRIMLALRALLVSEADVSTLVFDEVDQGIGGAVAEAVGRRMQRLALNHQVLCVTHLPQIAALADSHLRVSKRQEKNRTWTEVETLERDDRVEELARMLAGKAVTDAARAHARELIELSRLGPATAGKKKKHGLKKGF